MLKTNKPFEPTSLWRFSVESNHHWLDSTFSLTWAAWRLQCKTPGETIFEQYPPKTRTDSLPPNPLVSCSSLVSHFPHRINEGVYCGQCVDWWWMFPELLWSPCRQSRVLKGSLTSFPAMKWYWRLWERVRWPPLLRAAPWAVSFFSPTHLFDHKLSQYTAYLIQNKFVFMIQRAFHQKTSTMKYHTVNLLNICKIYWIYNSNVCVCFLALIQKIKTKSCCMLSCIVIIYLN